MTHQENQKELKRHRDIILATIDYSLNKLNTTMKIDGRNPWESRYHKLKKQTEQYFQNGKIDRLQKMLAKVLEEPQKRVDVSFKAYIKEETGFEINIFQSIRERAHKIIGRNKIKSEKELQDISSLIHLLEQESGDKSKIEALYSLCRDFLHGRTRNHHSSEHVYQRREFLHIQSPNKRFRLTVYEVENSGEHGMTTVSVSSKNAGASLYDIDGINLNIKAYWENDSKIVIESRKDCTTYTKHNQIQFGEDIILIEFSEI